MENPGLAQLLTVPTSWDKTRAPHLPPIASQLSAPLTSRELQPTNKTERQVRG